MPNTFRIPRGNVKPEDLTGIPRNNVKPMTGIVTNDVPKVTNKPLTNQDIISYLNAYEDSINRIECRMSNSFDAMMNHTKQTKNRIEEINHTLSAMIWTTVVAMLFLAANMVILLLK